ncbi:MAG TPA: ABC transporter ATP-binding protein [Acidimicrobiales bacterium]|nr:ABC transporter ATP-binding protein [Acidimicrobiales bacterium]
MSAALELEGVQAGYGRIQVLHGVDMVVPAGSVVALLGPNGVGKTTTLRAISGTLPVASGAIRLDGRRIDNRRPNVIASRGVRLVPEGRGVFPALSVQDNLRILHRSAARELAAPWEDWLAEVTTTFPRLGERLDQAAGSLSGGEQQMLSVCRALGPASRVVLFDELSMGLAPMVVAELFERVAALRAQGRTIVLVEQHLTYALDLADLCYVLGKGRVVWAGEPGELRRNPRAAAFLG